MTKTVHHHSQLNNRGVKKVSVIPHPCKRTFSLPPQASTTYYSILGPEQPINVDEEVSKGSDDDDSADADIDDHTPLAGNINGIKSRDHSFSKSNASSVPRSEIMDVSMSPIRPSQEDLLPGK